MPIADRKYKALTLKNVDRSPLRRGVYELYADKKLIYVGHALGRRDTIRSRLRTHLDAAKDGVNRYKREPSAQPLARQKELLQEYLAAHGRLPARNAARA